MSDKWLIKRQDHTGNEDAGLSEISDEQQEGADDHPAAMHVERSEFA